MNTILQKAFPHLIAIASFLLVCAVYFSPQLQGKVLQSSDVTQYEGMRQEIKTHWEETGEVSLWTNSMFGGMPTYQIGIGTNNPKLVIFQPGNYLKGLEWLVTGGFIMSVPIRLFFIAMLCFYISMILLGVNRWLAIIGAIAFSLTTNNLILVEAGHETQLRAITYLPLIASGMLLAFRKKYLLGGLLFAIGLGMSLMSNHIQMTYYFFLTLLVFGVAQLIDSIRKNELADFGKATGVLVIAALLGIGSTASNLWVTYEYGKDTMRGEPILSPEGEPSSSSETDGLEWEYAMQWSNKSIDMYASFIPGVAGGGSQEPVGSNSAIVKDLRRKGARLPSSFYAPLYWGGLPFTSGPIYLGAVMCLLFLMGLTLVKGPIKWWIGIGVLLTFMISLGKNMSLLGFNPNELLFDYFPLFNKFRTPNSVLCVTAMLVPLFGVISLHKIINGKVSKQEALRSLYIALGIGGIIAFFFAFLGSGFYDFTNPGDARYEQSGFDVNAIMADRKSLMRSDALRTLLLIALSGGLIWAYLQEKVKLNILLIGLAALVIFDQWGVGKRYLNDDNFVNKRQSEAGIQARPSDKQILQDTDLSFRVYDASESAFQSATASYHHKSIGGYHAAKLQRAQDMIDRHYSQGNQRVFDMMNTRYFILPEDRVQRNPNALGNAWFVNAFHTVSTPNEEIDALTDFRPDSVAVVHQEFEGYISGLNVDGSGAITLTDYKPNHLTYSSNTTAEQFAVFSEVWYGPDKGWQAYVDGEAVDHIRVNYILRGIKVPAGQHTIEFKFDPASFRKGKLASQIFSGLIVLGLLGFVGYKGYDLYQNPPEKPAPKPAPKPAKKAAPSKGASAKRKKKKK